jgi:mannose-6-phosphate isomerase-like protein (cupin superfamily)
MKTLVLVAALSLVSLGIAAQNTPQNHANAKGANAEHVKTYTPDALQWSAAPNALPSGAQLAVLEGDPMKPGPYTMRLKMPDGYKIPPHHHARREHVTVVSGSFKVGMGDKFDDDKMSTFAPGSFAYLEPTVHHYAKADGETVIQLHGAGPWEIVYINPLDDPRKHK